MEKDKNKCNFIGCENAAGHIREGQNVCTDHMQDKYYHVTMESKIELPKMLQAADLN